jgi:hypothetical protein
MRCIAITLAQSSSKLWVNSLGSCWLFKDYSWSFICLSSILLACHYSGHMILGRPWSFSYAQNKNKASRRLCVWTAVLKCSTCTTWRSSTAVDRIFIRPHGVVSRPRVGYSQPWCLQVEDWILPSPGRQHRRTGHAARTQFLSLRMRDSGRAFMTSSSLIFIPCVGNAGHARRSVHPTSTLSMG